MLKKYTIDKNLNYIHLSDQPNMDNNLTVHKQTTMSKMIIKILLSVSPKWYVSCSFLLDVRVQVLACAKLILGVKILLK